MKPPPGTAARSLGARRSRVVIGALALDLLLADPVSRWHPVAVAGRGLALAYDPWRRRPPPGQLAGGAVGLAALAVAAGAAAWTLERLAGRLGRFDWLALAAALKPSFAARQLFAEADEVAVHLQAGRLVEARQRLSALVSRPTEELPTQLVASAAIESVAENLADSILAPLIYYRAFGLPGAFAYRVVNTADAMFGYRGELEWLGKAAARTDDVLNCLPSRLAALSITVAAALLRGPEAGSRALRLALLDGRLGASPNAGLPMAAMAGALGRRLEKPGHHVLGADLPYPDAADVRRGIAIGALAASLAVAILVLGGVRR